jgi:hypothetical protein
VQLLAVIEARRLAATVPQLMLVADRQSKLLQNKTCAWRAFMCSGLQAAVLLG